MDFSLPQANDFFTASFYALSPLIPWLLTVIPMGWGGGGCNLDYRSFTNAYTIYFGGNPIFWCSKKQQSIAWPSIEVEFRAIATTVYELCWQ